MICLVNFPYNLLFPAEGVTFFLNYAIDSDFFIYLPAKSLSVRVVA